MPNLTEAAAAARAAQMHNLHESVRVDVSAFRTESMMEQELGEDTVLLYKDMQDLVYKVMKDIDNNNRSVQQQLAEKMLSFEKHKTQQALAAEVDQARPAMSPLPPNPHRNILAQRMTLSLAANAPQIRMRDSTLVAPSTLTREDESMGLCVSDDEEKGYHAPDLGIDAAGGGGAGGAGGRATNVIGKSPVSSMQPLDRDVDRETSLYDHKSKMTAPTSVRQRTLTIEDEWVAKVMNDLQDGDDSHRYDYSHSERL